MTTRSAGGPRLWRSAALALVLLCAALPARAQGDIATAVKAAYLNKFAPYVRWPAQAAFSTPFAICIVGVDPFGALADQAAANQAVDQRPVTVLRFATLPAAGTCQIIFAGGPNAVATVTAVAQYPVLTVTDLPSEAPIKGMINFVVRDNHVRFEIDNQAATRAGLVISSKLLSLAVNAGAGEVR